MTREHGVITRRAGVALSVVACMLAAAACGGGDDVRTDDTTRNLFVPTTKPLTVATPTTTPPRVVSTTSTTAPPRAALPGGVAATNEVRCIPTGVSGQFTPSTVQLPGDRGQSGGLAVDTSCDPSRPAAPGTASTPTRVFVIEAASAPVIRSTETVGEVDIRIVDGRRVFTSPVQVITGAMPVSSAMRAQQLSATSLEVRITQRAEVPEREPDEAIVLRQQSSLGATRQGVFDVDSELATFEVRWAAQERRVGSDIYRRPASEWSRRELVSLQVPGRDPFVMVAFGDSYGSGEGNPAQPLNRYRRCWSFWGYDQACANQRPFEDATLWDFNEVGANELVWGTASACHRSSKSGVAKAVQQLNQEWNIPQGTFFFGHFACSGAQSKHIVNTSYGPDWTEGFPCRWTNPGQSGTCKKMPPQITHATSWLSSHNLNSRDVDVVVVSIGGNDAGFADLIASCFVLLDVCGDAILSDPSTLNAAIRTSAALVVPVVGWFFADGVIPTWRRAEEMQALRNALRSVATAARAAFPNASVMFTTYTDGISVDSSNPSDRDRDGVCSEEDFTSSSQYPDDWNWTISAQSARWLQGVMREINSTIKDEVSRLQGSGFRVQVVSEQSDNHTNNGFCTGRANSTMMFSDEAAVTQGDDISDIADLSSGGWHPSDLGYQFYGRAIAKAITADRNFARTWPMFDR